MTEDISQVYENVDIKAWAQQIRKDKIAELKKLVEDKRQEAREFCKIDLGEYTQQKYIDEINRGIYIAIDLLRMECKLRQLIANERKD